MFKQDLKNETISLGALYQACNEIKKVAWQGEIDAKLIEPLIFSVYQTTVDNIEDIYINLKRINTGLDYLRKQLVGDAFSKDAEVIRYFEAISILVKNLYKNENTLSKLRSSLNNFNDTVNQDNLNDHASYLSELYLDTISKIEPRIIVNGDNKYLKEPQNAAMIRALLLSAIRSYILWQQSGGSKLRLFLFRKKIAQLAVSI